MHTIDRRNIFVEVTDMFENSNHMEYPTFLNEEGLDTGGLLRDMLSEFWKNTLPIYFEGDNQMIPLIHAHTNMVIFSTLGKILSHGYLISGVLPLQVAFPSMASVLLGINVEFDDQILIECFANCLSHVEADHIKQCLQIKGESFSETMRAKLVEIFDRFGGRETPTPSKLKTLILQAARFHFTVKPMSALCLMNCGVPEVDKRSWANFSVRRLYNMYKILTADPKKVLSVIKEPDVINAAEDRVLTFLRQYIGNMSRNEVEVFLRFVTGSSVMPVRINVTFNALQPGVARRPISHTCDNTIELSSTYVTMREFANELWVFIHNDEFSWIMIMDSA